MMISADFGGGWERMCEVLGVGVGEGVGTVRAEVVAAPWEVVWPVGFLDRTGVGGDPSRLQGGLGVRWPGIGEPGRWPRVDRLWGAGRLKTVPVIAMALNPDVIEALVRRLLGVWVLGGEKECWPWPGSAISVGLPRGVPGGGPYGVSVSARAVLLARAGLVSGVRVAQDLVPEGRMSATGQVFDLCSESGVCVRPGDGHVRWLLDERGGGVDLGVRGRDPGGMRICPSGHEYEWFPPRTVCPYCAKDRNRQSAAMIREAARIMGMSQAEFRRAYGGRAAAKAVLQDYAEEQNAAAQRAEQEDDHDGG